MTEQELENLTTELTEKFENHSNKFIGLSCNYVNGKLLEHSLNNILSFYFNDNVMSATSRVKLNEDLTDYEGNAFSYDVSLIVLEETDRVQINLVFEATV